MAEGAVEDRLVAGPQVPFAGVRPELDVGDGAELGGLLQLLGVHLVVGGERRSGTGVGRADVDKGHVGRVGSECLAHHGHPGPGVGDDGALADLEALLEEWDGTRDVLLAGLVHECVVP
jgi:hypothetical protein